MNTPAVLTDLKNKSKLLSYAVYKIKAARAKLILNVIFAALAFPAASVAACIISSITPDSQFYEEFSNISIILTSLCSVSLFSMALLTYLNGAQIFDYYCKRSVVDINYSLPLTRKERFWGDFMAGVLPNLILYVLSSALAVIILFFGKPSQIFSSESAWPIIFKIILTGFVFLIFLYTMVVFCTSLSGRMFEALVYPFVFSGLVPALISLFFVMAIRHPSLIYDEIMVKTLIATSPMGFLAGSFAGFMGGLDGSPYAFTPALTPEIIIPLLVIIAIFVAASAYLAQKRVTERVGTPFVFKAVYHIYLSAIIFVITSLFIFGSNMADGTFLSPSMFFAVFITTAFTFLIVEVITNRGFKKMHVAAIRYAATVAGSLLLGFALYACDSFGLYKKVPEPAQVSSFELSSVYLYDYGRNIDAVYRILDGSNYAYIRFGDNKSKFENLENIETMVSCHLKTVKNDNQGANFMISYNLKNGGKLERRIFIETAEQRNMMADILTSAEYRERELAAFEKLINFNENGEISRVNMYNGHDVNASNIAIEDRHGFFEAFKSDYLLGKKDGELGEYLGTVSISASEYRDAIRNESMLYFGISDLEFNIFSGYENTVKFLIGMNYPINFDYSKLYDSEIFIGNYENSGYKYTNCVITDWENDERVLTLLKYSFPSSVYTDSITIDASGMKETLIVPEYLIDLAKEVIDEYGAANEGAFDGEVIGESLGDSNAMVYYRETA
ncbi:MAG: hypothetical protein LBR74_08560 [Eubacterium sp.]|jgi:ABC-type transport system involved in multi-copper enzyme maturation permease subunit|nr:hypothetical protein [Eubacterium sp.]